MKVSFMKKGVVKIGGLILKIKKFNMGYVSQISYLFLFVENMLGINEISK